MHMSVHAHAMYQEICLNQSTFDILRHKVRLSFTSSILLCKVTVLIRTGEPELGFFEGARAEALFSDVSGAEAEAIKIFGSSYPIIEKM